MKKLAVSTGLIFILGVFGFGQKQKQQPVDDSAGENRGVVLEQGTRIEGQLQSTVDVRKSNIGDEVVLKTTKTIKQNGRTVVPKGSRLIGRVTDVQQKTKSNGTSRLGMVFDRIEGKNLDAPISASIVSITNAAANARIADTADADIFGSSSASAGGSSGGGGLLGGVTGTVGGALNTTTQTVGGITKATGQTIGSTAGAVTRTIDGIQISNSVDGSVQSGTTLSAANRNIKLEKGVTIGLRLTGTTSAR